MKEKSIVDIMQRRIESKLVITRRV